MIAATAPSAAVAEVAGRLDKFFDDSARRAPHSEYRQLWRAAQASSRGGKLLRPKLVLLAHAAFADEMGHRGGDADALSVATAFELLHTAFLLHDDVMDHDLSRRGAPNLIATRAAAARALGVPVLRAREYGEACAILAGDLLISGAYRLIGELDAPSGLRRELIRLIDEALFATAGGEHDDVLSALAPAAHGDLDPAADASAAVRVMDDKTARYTFCAPLQAGALLGGASPGAVAALAGIGHDLGIAFQAKDDLLGVFGDPSETGKSALSDLREGKRTMLTVVARQHPLWQEVAVLFGDPHLDEAGAEKLRTVIELSGARARTEEFVGAASERALEAVRLAELPLMLTEALADLAVRAAERVR